MSNVYDLTTQSRTLFSARRAPTYAVSAARNVVAFESINEDTNVDVQVFNVSAPGVPIPVAVLAPASKLAQPDGFVMGRRADFGAYSGAATQVYHEIRDGSPSNDFLVWRVERPFEMHLKSSDAVLVWDGEDWLTYGEQALLHERAKVMYEN